MDGTKLIHQNTRNQSAICHVFVYNYFVIQIKMHILQISVVYFTDRKKICQKRIERKKLVFHNYFVSYEKLSIHL